MILIKLFWIHHHLCQKQENQEGRKTKQKRIRKIQRNRKTKKYAICLHNIVINFMSDTSILLETPDNIKINKKQYQKIIFINNALEDGWSIKKINEKYIFTKKHENRREIFQEDYLENFIISNFKT
jgi:succinylglutamate desuccinylase